MRELQLMRFAAKTLITESGCIEWTSARDRNGYAKFWLNGRSVYAHVVAYEHWVGPVPEGMETDHLCRNRGCVCPTHLEAVTPHENMSRRHRPVRTKCGSGEHDWVPENWYFSRGKAYCKPCCKEHARRNYQKGREVNSVVREDHSPLHDGDGDRGYDPASTFVRSSG